MTQAYHADVSCNGCSCRDFCLRRYKCLICNDFDLCGLCFDKNHSTSVHLSSHPMQCMITRLDHSYIYAGENISKSNVQSFTCPLCNELGFSESSLYNHVFCQHPNPGEHGVLCPICAVQNDGDPNKLNIDLAHHFRSVHHTFSNTTGEGLNAATVNKTASTYDYSYSNKWLDASKTLYVTPNSTDHSNKVDNVSINHHHFSSRTRSTADAMLDFMTASSRGPLSNWIVTGSPLSSALRFSNNSKRSSQRLLNSANSTTPVLNVKELDHLESDRSQGKKCLPRMESDDPKSNRHSQVADIEEEEEEDGSSVTLPPTEDESFVDQIVSSRSKMDPDRTNKPLVPESVSHSKQSRPFVASTQEEAANGSVENGFEHKELGKKSLVDFSDNPVPPLFDDWDFNWHLFLTELVWSSLISPKNSK